MVQRQRGPSKKSVIISASLCLFVGFFMLFGLPMLFPTVENELHKHIVLTVIENGKQIEVPSNIGNKDGPWYSHQYDSLGLDGFAALHTHDKSGTIHVEVSNSHQFVLKDFLDVWGYDLGSNAKLSINGLPTESDLYNSYTLHDDDKLTLYTTKG